MVDRGEGFDLDLLVIVTRDRPMIALLGLEEGSPRTRVLAMAQIGSFVLSDWDELLDSGEAAMRRPTGGEAFAGLLKLLCGRRM